MDVNSWHAVNGDRPISRFSSSAASKPLEVALAMCSLYFSLASITTPRILTWSLGWTVCPLIVNGSDLVLCGLWVKCMIAVFSTLNVTPLLLSQSRASLMIASMPSQLLHAMGPVTHAVKSLVNAIAPLWLLIQCCTRSALKKRNRIGD